MDAETAITIAVIVLAAFMLTATIYGVWLSLQPRYVLPDAIVTPPDAIGHTMVECRAVREARAIIEARFDNKEVME